MPAPSDHDEHPRAEAASTRNPGSNHVQSGRFTILEHRTAQGTHWDFLLEWGDVLRTWALERLPEPGCQIVARRLPDHRTRYLDYEAPVSRGRGSVRRWAGGTYTLVDESEESLLVDVAGGELTGRVALRRKAAGEPHWSLEVEG